MSVWDSERGCSGTQQPLFVWWAVLGLRCPSLVRFCHVYMHAHTVGNPSQKCRDGGKDAVARQILGKRGALHTMAARRLIDASQAPAETAGRRFTDISKSGFMPTLSCRSQSHCEIQLFLKFKHYVK